MKRNLDFTKKYYYKKDRPPKKGELFTDPYFPPNDNSLLAKNENGEFLDKVEGEEKAKRIKPETLKWRRASEIYKGQKYLLFEDIIEIDDVIQGKLGDCYFLSSLAALSEYPYLIYNMFLTKEINPEGYFEVVLYFDGKFQAVIVDDYLPCLKSGEIAFAKPHKNEIWVCILEKAWAKINGGYANIISGWMRHALQAFTGFGHSSFNHKKTDKQRLWRELEYAEKNSCLMTGSSAKDVEETGIVKSHAYTIPKVLKINSNGERIKLVKLRNTWGFKEWNGDWSDSSDKWGPEELSQVQEFKNANDGSFFMSFDDYFDKYVVTDICYLQYNCHSKSFYIDPSEDLHKKGVVICVALPEDGFITFNLMRKMWRYNRELRNVSIPSMIAVFKIDIEEGNTVVSDFEGIYEAYEDISISKVFKAGLYIVYAFRDFSEYTISKDITYIIKIDSPVDFRYKMMPPDDPEKGLPYLQSVLLRYFSKQNEFKLGKEKTVLTVSEHGNSGLSARFFYNTEPEKIMHVTVTNNVSNLITIFNYPKNKDGTYDFYVEPNFYGVVIGIRKEPKKKGTFKTSAKLGLVKTNPKPTNFDISGYEDYYLINENIGDPKTYYDRTSLSLEKAEECKKFDTVATSGESNEKQIQESEPKYFDIISKMPEPKNNKSLKWANKRDKNGQYIGQINNKGKREGRGIFVQKEDYIVGNWKNNEIDGEGKIYSKLEDKLVYEGQLKGLKKEGKGKYYYVNGDTYEGNFVGGKMQGMGKHTFSKTGATWEGNYENGKMNDEGTYTEKKGKAKKVKYVNGKLEKSSKDKDEKKEAPAKAKKEPHGAPHGGNGGPHGKGPHGENPKEKAAALLSEII